MSTRSNAPAKFRLSPQQRVKRKSDFHRVQTGGRKLYSKHFLTLVSPGTSTKNRIGITVTTKVDKRAVKRNRVKRLIREVFRLNQHKLRDTFDIVVIARQNATECTLEEVSREVLGALSYHGFLKGKIENER